MILNILFAFLSCSFQADNREENDGNKIVAEVDSIKITAEEFYLSYEYGPSFPKKKKDSKERYLNYMINEKLLALDGYSRGIDTSAQAAELLEEFASDLAAEELYKQFILSKVQIDRREIDTVLSQKNLELEIKWIYAGSDEEIKSLLQQIKLGSSFDSLFNQQLNDTVFYDNRYMKIDRYSLQRKNPQLAALVDSLKQGEISLPVHTNDGWYIFKLENIVQNMISSESVYEKAKQEAVNSLKKDKMDKLSDQYVNQIMTENNPVIKRDAFSLLRSYLGNYLLPEEKYSEWNLNERLNTAVENLNNSGQPEHAEAVLVEMKNAEFTIADFITWYRNRSNYIRINKNDLKDFSLSLEKLIWRMVRDRLLAMEAFKKGLNNTETVIKQTGWWKDKIVSGIVKNELRKSVVLESKELNTKDSEKSSGDDEEFTARLLRKILSLKKDHIVRINKKLLDEVDVSAENDPHAVEFYIVKEGTLIPRTPYPTIDHDWAKWE